MFARTSTPSGASSLDSLLIIATIVLVTFGVVGLLLTLLSRFRHRSRMVGVLLEPLILIAGMFLLAAWMSQDSFALGSVAFQDVSSETDVFEILLVGALIWGIVIGPGLLLVRLVPNRLGVVLGCLAWAGTLTYGIHVWKTEPVVREIREEDVIGLFKGTLLLGAATLIPLRMAAWLLMSLLGAFYFVRHRFSYGSLVLGGLLGGYLGALTLTPFAIGPRWWLAPVCFAAFTAIMCLLPLQRRGFERLLGIQLSHAPPAAPLPFSALGQTAGHIGLVALAGFAACSAAANYYERLQYRAIQEGPPPIWRSPAEVNAFEEMKFYFRKGEGLPLVTSADQPRDYGKGLDLIDQVSSASRARILGELNREEWKAYFAQLREFIEAMERAGKADYLAFPGAEAPGFLNLRETARALAIRSVIALHENRPLDAVYDVRTVFRMAGLMKDQPYLVSQMIGAALKGVATGASWSLLAQGADNQELVEALLAMLQEVAGSARGGLDYVSLWEFGSRDAPILTNVEWAIPAFARAHENALIGWMNFDLVQLATALELYRIKGGGYPEELQELTPSFLKRIPREPIEGREYHYRRTADGSYELRNLAYNEARGKNLAKPLVMPPMLAPDLEEDEPSTGTKVVKR